MNNATNNKEWKLISQDAEKRADKPTKKLMNDLGLDEAKCVVYYKRGKSDKDRDIVNISSETYGINGCNTKKKKTSAANHTKSKSHSKHSFKELNMDDEKAEEVISTFEKYGPDYADNKIGLYRLTYQKNFVEPGLMPDLTLGDSDGSAPIARGFLGMLQGKKYPDICKKHVIYLGKELQNNPDDEGWIWYDYRKGNISSMDVVTYDDNGVKSAIYKYDCPGNPWEKEEEEDIDIQDLKNKGFSDEDIDAIKRYNKLNGNNEKS